MRRFVVVVAFIVFGAALCIDAAAPAYAQRDLSQYGLVDTARESGLAKESGNLTLPDVVGNVVGTALSLIGVVFFTLMIYGGFLWMTARGNEDQTKKALGTITAAVIGLIVILASYAITAFVLGSVQQRTATPQAPVQAPGGNNNQGPAGVAGVCVDLGCEPGIGDEIICAALEPGGCQYDDDSGLCYNPDSVQCSTSDEDECDELETCVWLETS